MRRRFTTLRRLSLLWGLALVLAALPLVTHGAALFNDDFEDGDATGWSTSGGSWSVVADDTRVYRQNGTSADARALAGSSSWGDYAVEARVKPISFNGADRFVAVVARAQSSTSYYYLALRSSSRLELKRLVSGSGTTLATKSFAVAAGQWYTLRLEVQGSTLRGYVNGVEQLTATDTRFASGRVGLATFYASALFDNVAVTSAGAPSTPTPATPTATAHPSTATPTATARPPTATPASPTATPTDRIFPGAQGFGVDSPAGRGGQIIKVTNLNNSGPGSLREALATAGPRIIVFEVGGVIDLNLQKITLTEPFVTIAGQTAPSPGITLIRGGMEIRTHDVLMKHLRFRIGDAGQAAGSGFEPDVSLYGPNAYNVVIDHCSFSWGVDENLSASGPRFDGPNGTSRRLTFSNNIIAEGLYDSIHAKGIHSMGSLIHDYVTDVAVIGNLYAHNYERNPWFKGFATGVIVNNVVYNPGKWVMRLGPVLNEWSSSGITPEPPRVSIVGNYMRYGVNTPAGQSLVGSNSTGTAYMEDNIALDRAGAPAPLVSGNVTLLSSRPSWPAGLTALPASQVRDHVAAHAGARPRDRDSVDARIVSELLNGTGQFVNSQNDVGGYPAATPTYRPLNIPSSNIDAWLHQFSLELE